MECAYQDNDCAIVCAAYREKLVKKYCFEVSCLRGNFVIEYIFNAEQIIRVTPQQMSNYEQDCLNKVKKFPPSDTNLKEQGFNNVLFKGIPLIIEEMADCLDFRNYGNDYWLWMNQYYKETRNAAYTKKTGAGTQEEGSKACEGEKSSCERTDCQRRT